MKSFVTLAQQNTAASAKTVQASAAGQTKSTVQVPAGKAPAQEEPRSALDGFGSMMPMIIVMAVLIYFIDRKSVV